MKNGKVIFILGATSLIVLCCYGLDYLGAVRSYNKLREDAHSPILEKIPIGRAEQRFLDEVQDSWMVYDTNPAEGDLMDLCELLEFERTTKGFVQLCTHEIPLFSISDKKQNLREAGRAGGLSQFTGISIDGKIYTKEGVAYLRFRDNIVYYYEDTDEGVKNIIYARVENIEGEE